MPVDALTSAEISALVFFLGRFHVFLEFESAKNLRILLYFCEKKHQYNIIVKKINKVKCLIPRFAFEQVGDFFNEIHYKLS